MCVWKYNCFHEIVFVLFQRCSSTSSIQLSCTVLKRVKVSSCLDHPTQKGTILTASPVSSSPRYTYACRHPSKQLQSQLPVFLFPIAEQLSLNAFSVASALISGQLSAYSVIVIVIPFNLGCHLQFLPHTALLFTVIVSFSFIPVFIVSSICWFFSPSNHPFDPTFHHISFIRSDSNSWCKCQDETMLKVSLFVCTLADLITA